MVRSRGVSGRIVAAVIVGAIGVGFGGVASAQPKPAATQPAKPGAKVDPKKAYTDGEKKFKAGDYAGALVDFQAADSIKQTPHAARYIGLCQDNLGHYQDAVAAYERFLANVPPK